MGKHFGYNGFNKLVTHGKFFLKKTILKSASDIINLTLENVSKILSQQHPQQEQNKILILID